MARTERCEVCHKPERVDENYFSVVCRTCHAATILINLKFGDYGQEVIGFLIDSFNDRIFLMIKHCSFDYVVE